MSQITNKQQMYLLLNAGYLGNTFKSWESWEAVLESGYSGLMSIRSKTVSNPVRLYDRPHQEIKEYAESVGKNRKDLVYYEATPVETRVIQGEISRLIGGLYLFHTFDKDHMRPALERNGIHSWRSEALVLLKTYVDPPSLDWIFELLDKYPDCVIEFTTFSVNVGVEHKSTVIWEVRNY